MQVDCFSVYHERSNEGGVKGVEAEVAHPEHLSPE